MRNTYWAFMNIKGTYSWFEDGVFKCEMPFPPPAYNPEDVAFNRRMAVTPICRGINPPAYYGNTVVFRRPRPVW